VAVIALMTVAASLVFVCCLVRSANSRRRRLVSVHAGSHRRSPGLPPNPTLRYAMAKVEPMARLSPARCERMRQRARSAPAAKLLRNLGWHRMRVACRNSNGKQVALHLRRQSLNLVEVEFPGGELAKLTNASPFS
jgi:hypothetical protein